MNFQEDDIFESMTMSQLEQVDDSAPFNSQLQKCSSMSFFRAWSQSDSQQPSSRGGPETVLFRDPQIVQRLWMALRPSYDATQLLSGAAPQVVRE